MPQQLSAPFSRHLQPSEGCRQAHGVAADEFLPTQPQLAQGCQAGDGCRQRQRILLSAHPQHLQARQARQPLPCARSCQVSRRR